MKIVHKLGFVFFVIFSLVSCVSQKEIIYFQQGDKAGSGQSITKYSEPVIQTDDILSVNVSSLSKEASSFFNTSTEGEGKANEGYLVDINGNVEIPLVGQIKVSGLTTQLARDTIRKRLDKYLQNPAVTVRYKNFRIILLGEVVRPGVYTVPNEKINVIEALGLAGDLTIYGKRENITVIREINGKKEYGSINLNSRDLFESPYYYLRTNDVVYVEPGKGRKAEAGNFYRVAPLVLSSLTIIIVILSRFL